MSAWETFLSEDDRKMRFNDRFRGLVYDRPSGAALAESVQDYMRGFGHAGVTASQVSTAVGGDVRWVKRALHTLVEDGEVRVEEEMTRGPRASRRKVYFALGGCSVQVGSLPEYGPTNDWACGGGRKRVTMEVERV